MLSNAKFYVSQQAVIKLKAHCLFQLPNDTIIQVWQGGMEEVQRATSLGLNVIYSTCWYLDLIEYGTKWSKYYHCDPVDTMYGKFCLLTSW